eukprot:4348691-Pyramimonas_sp.AAC.2
MFCRLWGMASEGQVRQWALDDEPVWDAAVANNSALREACVRALEEEVHVRLRVPHGHALVDVHAFYDSIERPHLARGALRLRFPPTILFLELRI